MPRKSPKMQSNTPAKSTSKMLTGQPKRTKAPNLQPEVKYVYRKDAFKKVKIA
jgi:hypothetical protein